MKPASAERPLSAARGRVRPHRPLKPVAAAADEDVRLPVHLDLAQRTEEKRTQATAFGNPTSAGAPTKAPRRGKRLSGRSAGLTEAAPLRQVDGTFVQAGRRKLSYFSGCDYYRLARHPVMEAAVADAAEAHGLGVSASRVTTGNHPLYGALERALARYFQAEAALLVPSGYQAGMAVAQALAGDFDLVLLDERAHVCLADAARFFDAPMRRFPHRDVEGLGRLLRGSGKSRRPIVLTDGMSSRDGLVAPLADYLGVLPPGGVILVDDAHGAGIVGATGQGTLEEAGVNRRRVIQTVTLSKAFGAYGGAVLGSAALRKRIIARSGLFAGATPLPLPLAAGALAAVKLLRRQGARMRRRLRANAQRVKQALRDAGRDVPDAPGPIVAVLPRNARGADRLTEALLAARIYPPLVRYPGGPPGGYFRFVISSEHTPEQLEALIAVLVKFS